MKVEFFSTIAGVTEFFPVLPAQDCLPNWVSQCRDDYLKSDKRSIHIYRCPGIFDLMATGFVVTAWHDMLVETTSTAINITTPNEQLNKLSGKSAVSMQDEVARFFPKRPWSQKQILKINTPWNVLAPKGLKFLHIPMPYSDFFDFESVMGIHDPAISSEINIQGYINRTTGSFLIKAGTPICQLVPLTEKGVTHICRDMNKSDELWFKKKKFFDTCTFVLQRNRIKEAYNNFVRNR